MATRASALRHDEGRAITVQFQPTAEALLTVQDMRVAYPAREGGFTEVVRGVIITLGCKRGLLSAA